jgi:hypothetical protein
MGLFRFASKRNLGKELYLNAYRFTAASDCVMEVSLLKQMTSLQQQESSYDSVKDL